ncbi:MAG: winged helix-turn-helix domain-containing protein [Actinomycetales bacterium]|nr:winged helix-turn-helix domain-containing protein [Actinomycetales bacterium]
MRTPAPALAPFLRSDTQGEILALLLLDPTEAHSIADVARAVDAPPSVVHKEIGRLVEAGVLVDTRQGRSRLVRANPDYRLLRPLTELINGTYGPAPILTRALAQVHGIDIAYIYGSWAARHEGVTGAHPRDIDVLVIGNPSRPALNEAANAAEEALHTTVTITKVSPEAWAASDDPFLTTVRSRPLTRLDIGTEATT